MSDRPEHLLVDGYNVIKTVPYFHHFERTNLERARNALWQSLNAYAHRTGARVMLYFDGSDSVSFPPQQERGSIQILFSKAPQLADDLIKDSNTQLLQASERQKSGSKLIVFFILLAAVMLLFLDWLDG